MHNKISNVFTGERFVPGIDDSQLEIEHYQRYYSVLPMVKGKVVVDAACGEGYGSKILSSVTEKVTGIDISEEAIQRARKNYEEKGKLEFLVESIAKLSFKENSIDVVVSFETIEHVSEELQYAFLSEIQRVLKDDGLLIMSTPNKEMYSDLHNYHNEYHIKEFYKQEFLDFLRGKFKNVLLYNQYFEVTSLIDLPGETKKNVAYYKGTDYKREGKYYIAVAGNADIPPIDITHIYMNKYPEYDKRISRILELQTEVDERNAHIKKLDNEILELQAEVDESHSHIRELQAEVDESHNHIRELQAEVDESHSHIRELQVEADESHSHILELQAEVDERNARIKKQDNEILELQTEADESHSRILELQAEVDERNAHMKKLDSEITQLRQSVERLLEVEREYEREKHSKTYRIALVFRKLSVFFFPIKSKRRFLARFVTKAIRHPIQTMKMINMRRIKNAITILRTEDGASAQLHYNLVEEYEKSRVVEVSDKLDDTFSKVIDKPIEQYEKIIFLVNDTPDVSIIIPVYNQFDYTYQCLRAIKDNSNGCKFEIIIANDCSTDLTTRITEIVEGIHVVNNDTNLKFLCNCNNAAKFAKGKYIVFLNNDTMVRPNWLIPLMDLMESDTEIGMVGSKLVYANGYLQEAGGIIWKDASAWNYGNKQNPNDSEFNYVHEADYISGAAIMIRACLWNEIGGFDERYAPAYCEDSDLAFEVRKHGYKVVYQPKSVVVHFEGISNGTDITAGQKKYQVDNQTKFFQKWKSVLEKEHYDNGTNVFLAREKGRKYKHILVIDHYVPQYDKDAGSKTTFMYLKMLIRQGYKITFLGDNFYQHEPYTTELQQMGVFVLYGPKYAEHWKEWLEENIQFFDVFYLNRPHISVKYIDFIKERSNAKVIYYGHDLHFLRLQREYELNGDAKLLKESKDWMEKELYLMRKADMSYYPSDVEVEEIHKIDSTVPVKAITAYAYETFKDVQYDIANREGLLFVGGFGHGPNLDAVLWFLDKIYPEVYKRTKAPFYIVGSKAPEEITSITTEGVVVKGFVTEEELQKLYCTTRLTVVPLRYGAGVKGKVVEALYYGSPIVTTSVGAEGIRGIEKVVEIQDDEQAIINSICEMYDDGETMKEMSKKCQDFIRKNFAIDVVWNTIKEDFS